MMHMDERDYLEGLYNSPPAKPRPKRGHRWWLACLLALGAVPYPAALSDTFIDREAATLKPLRDWAFVEPVELRAPPSAVGFYASPSNRAPLEDLVSSEVTYTPMAKPLYVTVTEPTPNKGGQVAGGTSPMGFDSTPLGYINRLADRVDGSPGSANIGGSD